MILRTGVASIAFRSLVNEAHLALSAVGAETEFNLREQRNAANYVDATWRFYVRPGPTPIYQESTPETILVFRCPRQSANTFSVELTHEINGAAHSRLPRAWAAMRVV